MTIQPAVLRVVVALLHDMVSSLSVHSMGGNRVLVILRTGYQIQRTATLILAQVRCCLICFKRDRKCTETLYFFFFDNLCLFNLSYLSIQLTVSGGGENTQNAVLLVVEVLLHDMASSISVHSMGENCALLILKTGYQIQRTATLILAQVSPFDY